MNANGGNRENASAKPSGSVGTRQGGSVKRAAATQRAASSWLSRALGVRTSSRGRLQRQTMGEGGKQVCGLLKWPEIAGAPKLPEGRGRPRRKAGWIRGSQRNATLQRHDGWWRSRPPGERGCLSSPLANAGGGGGKRRRTGATAQHSRVTRNERAL